MNVNRKQTLHCTFGQDVYPRLSFTNIKRPSRGYTTLDTHAHKHTHARTHKLIYFKNNYYLQIVVGFKFVNIYLIKNDFTYTVSKTFVLQNCIDLVISCVDVTRTVPTDQR